MVKALWGRSARQTAIDSFRVSPPSASSSCQELGSVRATQAVQRCVFKK